MEIGGKSYPKESLDLEWANYYYILVYEASQDFKRNYFKIDLIPYVDKKGFKSMYPIIASI